MKIKFLGAAGSVTGSKYLISYNRIKFLVDCGLFQGLKKFRLKNWEPLPIPPHNLDFIILTHAHIDHSGYIPKLVRDGFKGKIYCTPSTRDLCKILLKDCGYLMEEEAFYANQKGFSKHTPAQPLYTMEDAKNSLKHFRTVTYNTEFPLKGKLLLTFKNAGHILGSAHVQIRNDIKSIYFSGDIGRKNHPLLYPPTPPHQNDYVVMESTYGNRRHSDKNPMDELEKVVNNTANRKGVLLIPAFAVGRTQLILFYLAQLNRENRIKNMPIYLNSPMAKNVNDVYCTFDESTKLDKDKCLQICNIAKYINTPEDSKSLNKKSGPMIIISASGMATGGRIIHHIKTFAQDKKNTLLFTGFQAAGTRGEAIINGAKTVKIHGSHIPIKSEVVVIHNLSAHADENELISWIQKESSKTEKIFLTHGEPEASNHLKSRLENEIGLNIEIPKENSEYQL